MKNILISLANSKVFLYLTYILFSFIAPLVAVTLEYGLYKQETSTTIKVATPVTIILLWAVFKFWGDIHDAVKTMKEGFAREFILSIMKLGPYILMFTIGILLKSFYEDYMFIATVLLITQALGVGSRARFTYLKRKELIDRGYVNVLK